jgi:hypothetical protein
MEYWNLPHENNLFMIAYEKYRSFFSDGEIKPKFAPYGKIPEGAIIPLELGTYYFLLAEHSQGIANEINNLYYRIAQFSAWDKVLREYDHEEKLLLLLEFFDPIANLAIGLPYVIRSRFIYSLSHLSHQANLVLEPAWDESKLPLDREINFNTMRLTTEGWQGYTDFLMCFRELNNEEFSAVTRNYRNSNQHRYPPRVEVGHTEFVTRNPKDTNNMYAITSKEPLKISNILPLLLKQYYISMNCYNLYDKIICNQLAQMHSNFAK